MQVSEPLIDRAALQGWVDLIPRHPALADIRLSFGTRTLDIALRRDGGLPALRVLLGHPLIERIVLGNTELLDALTRLLTGVDPYILASVEIVSAFSWWGDELTAFHRALREHFGGGAVLPRLSG